MKKQTKQMNNDNNNNYNKNPKPNKLLTLYGEFEYQIIDFVVKSLKIRKQCGKMVRDEATSSQNLTPKWRECFRRNMV